MHSLETMAYINDMACIPKFSHPKLDGLIYSVRRIGRIGGFYRAALISSVNRYAAELVTRSEEDMDNLEALQQVTLGDWNEALLHALCR